MAKTNDVSKFMAQNCQFAPGLEEVVIERFICQSIYDDDANSLSSTLKDRGEVCCCSQCIFRWKYVGSCSVDQRDNEVFTIAVFWEEGRSWHFCRVSIDGELGSRKPGDFSKSLCEVTSEDRGARLVIDKNGNCLAWPKNRFE